MGIESGKDHKKASLAHRDAWLKFQLASVILDITLRWLWSKNRTFLAHLRVLDHPTWYEWAGLVEIRATSSVEPKSSLSGRGCRRLQSELAKTFKAGDALGCNAAVSHRRNRRIGDLNSVHATHGFSHVLGGKVGV